VPDLSKPKRKIPHVFSIWITGCEEHRMQSEKPQTIEFLYQSQTMKIRFVDFRDGVPIVYLHGWGTNLTWFSQLMDSLLHIGRHIAIDFPGFGDSDMPSTVWGTAEYADFMCEFLKSRNVTTAYIIGHSFGGRVAIQMASRHPDMVKGLVLIAAAGIKRNIAFKKKIKVRTIRFLAKTAAWLIPGRYGIQIKDSLYDKIASKDYKDAGKMRPIFVKVVNEDLAPLLSDIQKPTILLYGSEDTETPPSMGRQMKELLTDAKFIELPGFDHYTIMSRAKHQVGFQIRQFVKGIIE
jgi:pimeloyl-ACP methyl ester carboxylesterase